ncbi:MAG: hypothetical protein GKS01_10510 [Alphaproteobacteria bacterium]|nr:hypothetical protein [Alphaproteobacteria bacterium]
MKQFEDEQKRVAESAARRPFHQNICIFCIAAFFGVIASLGVPTSQAHAAECKVSGHWLVVAHQKARSNGYKFKCSIGTFIPTAWQCVGRIKNLYQVPLLAAEFGCKKGKLKNGWVLAKANLDGHPGAIKVAANKNCISRFLANPKFGLGFSYRLTTFSIRKRGASCNNMPAVLTSAFGR